MYPGTCMNVLVLYRTVCTPFQFVECEPPTRTLPESTRYQALPGVFKSTWWAGGTWYCVQVSVGSSRERRGDLDCVNPTP